MHIKNFGGKGALAYPGTAQFLQVPLLSQVKLYELQSLYAHLFTGSIGTKPHLKFRENIAAGLSIFRASTYKAHRAVIFAVAQLSCFSSILLVRTCA